MNKILLATLAIAVSILLPTTTQAASIYDDTYQEASWLGLKSCRFSAYPTIECSSHQDITDLVIPIVTSSNNQLSQSVRDDINTALDTGMYAIVLKESEYSTSQTGYTHKQVRFYYTTNPNDRPLVFENINGIKMLKTQTGSNNYQSIEIQAVFNWNTNEFSHYYLTHNNQYNGTYIGLSYDDLSGSIHEKVTVFYSTIPVLEYPEGYEGKYVRQTPPTQPDYGDDLRISYEIDNKRIVLRNTTPVIPEDSVCWWVFDTNPSSGTEVGDDGNITQAIIDNVSCTDPVMYEYTKYGQYEVFLYVTTGGTTYNANQRFTIDGSSQVGVFSNEGVTPDPIYQECDLTDVLCHISNFGVWFYRAMAYLFTPNMLDLQNMFYNLRQIFDDQFGFLWFPFDFFINLFTQFSEVQESCSFSTSSVPGVGSDNTFFGQPVNLSVCSAEQDFPRVYQFVVFFLRLITTLSLLFALYYRIFQYYGGRSAEVRSIHT